MYTHLDITLLAEPANEPKAMVGICTDMIGVDGVGYVPLSQANLKKMPTVWS